MAKNGVDQLNVFTDWLNRLVGKDATRKKVMKALAGEALRIITVRSRLGKTARRTDDTPTLGEIKAQPITFKQLTPHSGVYQKFRKRYRKRLVKTTPTRQNITFSSQLLDSLEVARVSDKSATVAPDNSSRRDPISGKRVRLTNRRLARYVTEQGRPFLELSRLDDKKLVRFYRRQFGDLVRRFGKTK